MALKRIFLILLIFAGCLQISAATPTEKFVNQVNNLNKSAIEPDTKLWNLRNAEIRAVIDEVSRVTGKNFLVDPHVT
jgi:general secretion pathway protein D